MYYERKTANKQLCLILLFEISNKLTIPNHLFEHIKPNLHI